MYGIPLEENIHGNPDHLMEVALYYLTTNQESYEKEKIPQTIRTT